MEFYLRAVHDIDGQKRPWSRTRIDVILNRGYYLLEIALEGYTDDDGVATFELDVNRTTTITISVHGEELGPYEVDDGQMVTVEVEE